MRNLQPWPTEIRIPSLTVSFSASFTAMRAHRYRRPAASPMDREPVGWIIEHRNGAARLSVTGEWI